MSTPNWGVEDEEGLCGSGNKEETKKKLSVCRGLPGTVSRVSDLPWLRPSRQAGRSEVGFLAGSGPCSDLGNGHGAVVAPSANPVLPLGSGFEGQAPCNVETVADVEASWVSQTHLMSFNNHLE